MTRRKRRKASRPGRRANAARAVTPDRSPTAPRRWIAGASVLVVGVVVAVIWTWRSREGARPLVFPPPVASAFADGPGLDDFAGAETCAECHPREFAAWERSTHGLAGGPPNPETVIAPFDGRPMRFQDAVVIPAVSGGEYTFTVRQRGREDVVVRVDGVIGRGHMIGGGTQGFVTAYPDGTIRFLPFDYIRDEAVWFCNTNPRTGEGWKPITPAMRIADCGDWPPTRVLGTDVRLSNCQECHGSQISVRFDADEGRYQTHVATYAVDCESCHGPGREHGERARAGTFDGTRDIGIATFDTVDKDASLAVCFQCHAVKTVIEPGYLPGRSLERHYSPKLSVVGDEPFFPDGRVRTFAYQQNHVYSDCYLNGSMTCVDCHDPHSSGYRDTYGRPLEGRFSNGQCVSCHPSKGADVARHTKHATDSSGSQCVSCHMPYLQHPEVGRTLRFSRSDHTIPIPRPAFDEELGIENACKTCHANRSVEFLERQTTEWYGELKPHKDIVRGMLEFTPEQSAVDAAARLLAPVVGHPMAQLAALNAFQERYLRPDMPTLDAAVAAPLRRLARSRDLDVRAFALATLHYVRGRDPETRQFLIEQLESVPFEDDASIRGRWVVTLGYLGDVWRERGELETAAVVYQKALELTPEHPHILAQLADAYSLTGRHDEAIAQFERAVDADPAQSLTLVNYGVALERAGQNDAAAMAYRRALEINPNEHLAHFNLGNHHLRRDEVEEAIAYYVTAVTLQPGLAQGHSYLARSLTLANRLDEALEAAERALEFDRNNPRTRQMVQQLRVAVAAAKGP